MQESLLAWYRKNKRAMPWRARGGRRPDPYHVWLSEIMLQQTTVAAVGPYFERFIEKWPTIQSLASESVDEILTLWAGLGYYARARNLYKCAGVVVAEYGGVFPRDVETLLKLPGVGPYTAAAIASIAFDKPAAAVDGNVERVLCRYHAIDTPLPAAKQEIRVLAEKLVRDNPKPSDFTQALMELGATVCTPRGAKCDLCPWASGCQARRRERVADYPVRTAKKLRPRRYGAVYFLDNGKGQFLIHKRAGAGLYQGMYQLPTTEWVEKSALGAHPQDISGPVRVQDIGDRRDTGIKVKHVFTHFELYLDVWCGTLPVRNAPSGAVWVDADSVAGYALPSLMQKAVRAGQKG